jgi:eukaryotic-like serine/threonine-protein kinase
VQEASRNQRLPEEPGYHCLSEIGSGGYGRVYLLRQTENDLEPYVAGKFVYRDVFGFADDPAASAGYERALGGLQNFRSVSKQSEYLLRIFEVRERHDQGYFCYVMELADDMANGRQIDPVTYKPRTLKNELERSGRRERLPVRSCIELAIMLARGLQVLHESGFTHRDVRPSNIIFVRGVPKLADIDLLAGSDAALPSYIPRDYAAPEGNHSSHADLFSLGKTMYEMCTGLPVKAFPCLPPEVRFWKDHCILLRLNRIIAKACAPELRKRYESAQEVIDDLEEIALRPD